MPPGERRPRADDLPDKDLKARKAALFEDEGAPGSATSAEGPRKSFAEHLRDTPPAPMPAAVRAGLWAAGIVVALLFAATLYRSLGHKAPARPAARAGTAK